VEYPILDVPLLGGSMLIAVVAIVHVFIAHFSVGAGLWVAIAERRANRTGDTETLAFLKKYTLLILLVPYVLGTVTGVGIWFTIALVSPRGVSVLIHQFVFDWAMEWVLFLIEVVSIFLYFYTWGKISPKAHNRIGWIFAIASILTLFVINGILSFMLTPGTWQPFASGVLCHKALLNPGYLPTSLARILLAMGFAGAGAIALATFAKGVTDGVRKAVVSLGYKFIVPAILCVPLGLWTYAVLPERAQEFLRGGAPVMVVFLGFGLAGLGVLTLSAVVALLRRDTSTSSAGAIAIVLGAFVAFGAMEFVREGARKPFVIEGFMYSTGVTVAGAADVDTRANITWTQANGILSAAPWALPPGKEIGDLDLPGYGQAVFRAACQRCHQVDGYNAIRPLVRGWSAETVRWTLDRLDEIKPSMPPFPGTNVEKGALVSYLLTLNESTGKEVAK